MQRIREDVGRQMQRDDLPLAVDFRARRRPVRRQAERPARHRKEFVLGRAVGDRDLAVAEELRRRADLGRRHVLVEDPLLALDHLVVVRLDLARARATLRR